MSNAPRQAVDAMQKSLSYLALVKQHLNPRDYDDFVEAMRAFHAEQ